MARKKAKRYVHPTFVMKKVVSKAEADKKGLLILSVKEYAEKFSVHRTTALYRFRSLKINGFKSKGRVFLLVSKKSQDGF